MLVLQRVETNIHCKELQPQRYFIIRKTYLGWNGPPILPPLGNPPCCCCISMARCWNGLPMGGTPPLIIGAPIPLIMGGPPPLMGGMPRPPIIGPPPRGMKFPGGRFPQPGPGPSPPATCCSIMKGRNP